MNEIEIDIMCRWCEFYMFMSFVLSTFLAIAVIGFTIATFHEDDEYAKKMKKFIIPLCVSLAVTLLFFAVVHYQWIRTSSILKERRIEIKKIELEHNKLQQKGILTNE